MTQNHKVEDLKDCLKSHGHEVPDSNIIKEPEHSTKKLIELEYSYGLNTKEVIKNENIKGISKTVRNTWLKLYDSFTFFNGFPKEVSHPQGMCRA